MEAIISVGPLTIAARAGMPSKNGQQPLAMFVPVIFTSVLPPVSPKLGVTFDSVADAAEVGESVRELECVAAAGKRHVDRAGRMLRRRRGHRAGADEG